MDSWRLSEFFSRWWEGWGEKGVSSRIKTNQKQNPKTYKCFLSVFLCVLCVCVCVSFVLFSCEKWRKRFEEDDAHSQIKAKYKTYLRALWRWRLNCDPPLPWTFLQVGWNVAISTWRAKKSKSEQRVVNSHEEKQKKILKFILSYTFLKNFETALKSYVICILQICKL